MKTWKGEMIKTWLNVCRYLYSIKRLRCKHKDWELSANTVAFVSCRSRLTIMLAGASIGRREGGWGGREILLSPV